MAKINIHLRDNAPLKVKVMGGKDQGYLVLRIDAAGDEVTIFCRSVEDLLSLEDAVSAAVRAFQMSSEVE